MTFMWKNWMTTFAGAAAAGLNLLANGVGWKQCLISAMAVIWGAVQKDYNTVGVGAAAYKPDGDK